MGRGQFKKRLFVAPPIIRCLKGFQRADSFKRIRRHIADSFAPLRIIVIRQQVD